MRTPNANFHRKYRRGHGGEKLIPHIFVLVRGGAKGEHKIADWGACAPPPWEKSGVQWARARSYEFFGGSMVKIRSILTTFMRGRKSIIFCRKWGRKSDHFLQKMGPKIGRFFAENGAENRFIFCRTWGRKSDHFC